MSSQETLWRDLMRHQVAWGITLELVRRARLAMTDDLQIAWRTSLRQLPSGERRQEKDAYVEVLAAIRGYLANGHNHCFLNRFSSLSDRLGPTCHAWIDSCADPICNAWSE